MSGQIIYEKEEISHSNTNDEKTVDNNKNCSSKYLKDEFNSPF